MVKYFIIRSPRARFPLLATYGHFCSVESFSIFFFSLVIPPHKLLVPFEVIVVVHYSTININNKYLGSISKHNSLLPLLPASCRIVCKFSNTNISSLTGAVDAHCHLLAVTLPLPMQPWELSLLSPPSVSNGH